MRSITQHLLPFTTLSLIFLSQTALAQEEPQAPVAPKDAEKVESEEQSEKSEAGAEEDVEKASSTEKEAESEVDASASAKAACPEGEECPAGDVKKEPAPRKKIDLGEDEDESEASAKESIELDADDDREPKEGADAKKVGEAADAALSEAPPKEDSLWPIKFTTSTWSRFEFRENYSDLGVSSGRTQEGDLVVFRSRIGMRTNPLPVTDTSDVFVQFTPQASGHWGQSGTIGEADLGIYEAYGSLRTKRFDIQLGRMMMDYGDAVVIGNLDWNEKGRAFDGIRAHYKMDKGYLDLFGTQTSEAHPSAGSKFLGGDSYFWGAYAGIGGYAGEGDEDIDLDLYMLGLTSVSGNGLDDGNGGVYYQKGGTLVTMGSRARGKLGPVEIRAEAGIQFGNESVTTTDRDLADSLEAIRGFAYMGDLEFGVPLGSKTRVSIGGLIASGDDAQGSGGWNELYPTAHKFLGLMDVIGARTNIASGNLKFSRGITKGLTFKADGHIFVRLEDSPNGQEDGMAGIEVDAQLVQKLGKYFFARGLYGLFIPTSGHYMSDNLVSYVEAEAGINF